MPSPIAPNGIRPYSTFFADIFPAIRAGALSYLLKEVTPDELADAVRAAAGGEAVLHPGWPLGWSPS